MQFTNSYVENPEDCPAYVPPPDDPCATQNASVIASASSVCDILVNLSGIIIMIHYFFFYISTCDAYFVFVFLYDNL